VLPRSEFCALHWLVQLPATQPCALPDGPVRILSVTSIGAARCLADASSIRCSWDSMAGSGRQFQFG
jgi:hypothetical protein